MDDFQFRKNKNIYLHQESNSQPSRQVRKMELGLDKKAPHEATETTFLLQETILKITFPQTNICTQNYN
jgi:hypothetical protein